jgi:hypothetical protein
MIGFGRCCCFDMVELSCHGLGVFGIWAASRQGFLRIPGAWKECFCECDGYYEVYISVRRHKVATLLVSANSALAFYFIL